MTKTSWSIVNKATLAIVVTIGAACHGEGVTRTAGVVSEVQVTPQALTTVDVDRVLDSRRPRSRTGRSFRAARVRSAFRPRPPKVRARWPLGRTAMRLCRVWPCSRSVREWEARSTTTSCCLPSSNR
jgi:hypothetical protein